MADDIDQIVSEARGKVGAAYWYGYASDDKIDEIIRAAILADRERRPATERIAALEAALARAIKGLNAILDLADVDADERSTIVRYALDDVDAALGADRSAEPVGPPVTDPDRSPQNREAGGW